MKLVVIQGGIMTRYVDRKLDVSVYVPYWDFEGVHETVEEFRENGFPNGQ